MLFLRSLTVQNQNLGTSVSLVTPDLPAALCPANKSAPVSALVAVRVPNSPQFRLQRGAVQEEVFKVSPDVLAGLTPCFES